MTALLREKEAMVDTINKQLVQMKEDLRLKDSEMGQVL
jgi:t-SNARE complex subunit (syntaxin)